MDLARGYTAHGPHLDELAISLGGRPLRRYGSQGEQRTAVLALLFAERRALVEAGRRPPLMLLDDVMSELDARRRAQLARRLAEGGGQAVLTATEPDHLPGGYPRTEVALRRGEAITPPSRRAAERRLARRVSPRRTPRPLGAALRQARARAEPRTLLAAAQSAWPTAAGARVAAEAEPVAERDGVVTIACRSATWAQELDLLQPELVEEAQRGALGRPIRMRSTPPSQAFASPPTRRATSIDSLSLFYS